MVNSKQVEQPCGLLIPYSKEYQNELAEEIERLEGEEGYLNTVKAVNDYYKTRQSIRKCING